jgi:type I restriction enzyme M protein
MRGVERYEIRDGEILLPLRSQRLQAVVVRDAPAGVIASGQWAIIEPNPDLVDSHYLAWYLNHPRTRARLEGTMVGSALQFLTIAMVREFAVERPGLERQRQIGRVSELVSRVERLERELAIWRQSHLDAVAMTVVTDQSDERLGLDC